MTLLTAVKICFSEKLLYIQKKRSERIDNYCAKKKQGNNISIDFASIIDDAHKIVLVAIPKTGCSIWKVALYENREKTHQKAVSRTRRAMKQTKAISEKHGSDQRPNEKTIMRPKNATYIVKKDSKRQAARSHRQLGKRKTTNTTGTYVKTGHLKQQTNYARLNIHNFEFIKKSGLRWIHDLNDVEKRKVLRSYFNIITVRHPLDRLESSYQDKVMHYKQNADKIRANFVQFLAEQDGFSISKYFNDRKAPRKYQDNTTFENFLTFILQARNRHWNNFMDNAHLCSVKYRYVIFQKLRSFFKCKAAFL